MEAFYKKWLEINSDENEKASAVRKRLERSSSPQPSTSTQNNFKKPSDIVFENSGLKLIVEQGIHKHQKVFRIQDHLFYFKVVPTDKTHKLPLLADVLDFLHAAFAHVLKTIKTFYKEDDHNIAYLTIYQEPMINGLNTGKMLN